MYSDVPPHSRWYLPDQELCQLQPRADGSPSRAADGQRTSEPELNLRGSSGSVENGIENEIKRMIK